MGSRSNGRAAPDWRFPGKIPPAIKGLEGKRSLVATYLRSGVAMVLMLLAALACFSPEFFCRSLRRRSCGCFRIKSRCITV